MSYFYSWGGLSGEVSILVLPPILENLELVYLRGPGWFFCGGVVNQKVCLNIAFTLPYESHSKKASMPVEGHMILVCSSVKKVSVTAFLNPFISAVVLDEVFIESFIKRTGCDWP